MGRGKAKQYTKEEVLHAIKGCNTIISTVAKTLDCSWDTAHKYINKWQETKTAYENERQRTLDFAEGKLFKNIEKGDPGSIKYFLSKKGKERGYGDETIDEKVAEIVDTEIHIVNDFAIDEPEEDAPQNEA